MTPDITVIITAYNVESYIERAVRSALDQRGVELQVIAVDDASTDATWTILSSIRDPRLQCFRLETNGGPGFARNAAIARAEAPWLAVLDGDDVFLPNRLLRCLKRAEATQANIVVDNLRIDREADGHSHPMFEPDAFNALQHLELATLIDGTLPGIREQDYTLGYLKPMFSKAFLIRHQLAYPSDIRIGEDYLLLAEVLACGARCAIEPSIGYGYTVRKHSTSYRWTSGDIARIREADARLLAKYRLDPAVSSAQARREKRLQIALAFAMLVEAMKAGRLGVAVKLAMRNPSCLWLFKKVLKARLGRLRRA